MAQPTPRQLATLRQLIADRAEREGTTREAVEVTLGLRERTPWGSPERRAAFTKANISRLISELLTRKIEADRTQS